MAKPVYVDEPIFPFRGVKWCHMYSPDLDALHDMAGRIGVYRRWFQDKPGFPHYDLSPDRRRLAIKNGAVEVSCREMVEIKNGSGG